MSQAIQGLTPSQSPYQGNLQQQASAALASSSPAIQGDSIAPIAVAVVAGGGLLTLGTILAVNHFSTSGDKTKPAQATSPKSVERAHMPQLESVPTSTKETPLSQSAPLSQSVPSPHQPSWQSQFPLEPSSTSTEAPPPPSPQRKSTPVLTEEIPLLHLTPLAQPIPQSSQVEPISEFQIDLASPEKIRESSQPKTRAGKVDKYGVYREEQEKGDGLCGKCSLNTVFDVFDIPEMTTEEFKQQIAGKKATVAELMQIARKNGLEARSYDAEELEIKGITGMDDIKAFIIVETCDFDFFHAVALVCPEAKKGLLQKKGFHLSDSGDQQIGKVYPVIPPKEPCTVHDALLDYKKIEKVTVHGVLTFRKHVPTDVPERDVHEPVR